MSIVTGTVADLATGDALLNLAGIGFAQMANPDAPPVLVADTRPVADAPGHQMVEIVTSTGSLYAADTDPVRVTRDDTVTDATVLLISRRAALHSTLTALGTPVIRRTPVEPGQSTPAVTDREWRTAPLIVIDAYLAPSTLHTLSARSGLTAREQTVLVCDDPDSARAEARLGPARARHMLTLPYDREVLRSLFVSATDWSSDQWRPFPGILAPTP
jgi:hypothetical protein